MLLVLIAGLVFAFGPYVFRRVKYFDHYQHFTEVAAKWKRQPNHCEGYTFQASNGIWLSASTAEQKVADDFSTVTYDGATPDPSRFFVVPPGKWVDTIDEVFATWDEYD
ncbi:hypothetical protein [Crateriforma spongiae]|uniref:hypothetical protein n=1 Tax=Crateriforma spongiae TaxID=2724528 RepID=UPI0039AFECA9